MIVSANCELMANRELHTWQMTLLRVDTNRIVCSSQKPISRSLIMISAESGSCLIRTQVPALARLRGQRSPPMQFTGFACSYSVPEIMDSIYRLN